MMMMMMMKMMIMVMMMMMVMMQCPRYHDGARSQHGDDDDGDVCHGGMVQVQGHNTMPIIKR